MTPPLCTFEMIVAAAHRIRSHVRKTPLQWSQRLSKMVGSQVFMKMENMQHIGAYKERGALNKLRSLTSAEAKKGVFAASAGNHAQAVAFHAGKLNIKSTIFMPVGTPVIKVTRTKQYGADVELVGNNYDEADLACAERAQAAHGIVVHPFDDPFIIAGQGTLALEILDQAADIDTIVVPVGGGGLIAGVAMAAKEINPNIRIIGVEAAKVPAMQRALAGDFNMHPAVTTIADSINVRKVSELTASICRDLVDEWVSVSEEEMCRAILFLLEGEKTVAEAAGAAGVAALLSGRINSKGSRIVTIVTGGNIDVNSLAQVIDSGLLDSGRRMKLSMDLPDRPGSLTKLMNRIAEFKANVVSIQHERTRLASFGAARVSMTLDVSGASHSEAIVTSLHSDPLYEGIKPADCRIVIEDGKHA